MDKQRSHAVAPTVAAAALALATLLVAGRASADPIVTRPFEPSFDCPLGLDSLGTVVTAGGDYDGDGTADYAYAAPCSPVRGRMGAGRVWIRSGATGELIRKARGREERMYFGAALAFVGDLNGDGKDELAIGAPSCDRPAAGVNPKLADAGQLRVLTVKKKPAHLKIFGDSANAEFGSSVDGVADMNSDDVGDLLVGAPGEQRADTLRTGVVHILSGKNGAQIVEMAGVKAAQRFGTTVLDIGTYDADFVHDILVTSDKNPVGGVENAGGWEVRSGTNTELVLAVFGGAANDRLGASTASEGTDGTFIIGAPGRRSDTQLRRAGAATAVHGDDGNQFSVPSLDPEENAQFGTAVAAIGDVTNDQEGDFAVSEPFLDLPLGAAKIDILENAGRITVLSGAAGVDRFTIEGDIPNMWLGRSLAGGIDINHDLVPDFISGNPGDAPLGRRGAGTVTIFNGGNGNTMRSYRGARGIETRIFATGNAGSAALVRGFATDGTPAGVNAEVLQDAVLTKAEMSIDVLDRTVIPPVPGGQRLVVGTGAGAGSSDVVVLSGAKHEEILGGFEAFPGEAVGASVAAGDLDNDGKDEIAVAQGSSATGVVRVRVFGQTTNDPFVTSWIQEDEFFAFTAGEKFGNEAIDADSANLVITGLRPEAGREIVAAPTSGLPIVRVFAQTGLPLLTWPAYDLDGSVSGVSIAAADLNADGNKEILTVPAKGEAVVRAFTDDGLPFTMPGAVDPVTFLALPGTTTGARVTAADVDLDGRQEILVIGRDGGSIRAFEADGTEVVGFDPISVSGLGSDVAITATDTFLKK